MTLRLHGFRSSRLERYCAARASLRISTALSAALPVSSCKRSKLQVKVPPRAHGRVFAVNTVFAFGTLPIAFIVVGPAVSAAIGLGPTYLLFGAAIAVIALAAMRYRPLARFDADVPDTEPEDLIGLTEIRRRAAAREPRQEP